MRLRGKKGKSDFIWLFVKVLFLIEMLDMWRCKNTFVYVIFFLYLCTRKNELLINSIKYETNKFAFYRYSF